MPIYLENRDITAELAGCRSVLIVPCPICPAISLAVANREPYIRFFRSLLTTPAYARAIHALQESLESMGVSSVVHAGKLPIPLMCMWTDLQRSRLTKYAARHDAVVVLGCDSAIRTAELSVADSGRFVTNAMQVKGIVSVTPRFHWSGRVTLTTRSRGCIAWPDP
jgi:hypothetical protein